MTDHEYAQLILAAVMARGLDERRPIMAPVPVQPKPVELPEVA